MKPWIFALALGGCVFADARFTVDKSADITAQPISIIGAYRGGHMDRDAWDELRAALGDGLRGTCEAGFSDRLRDDDEQMYESFDRATKDAGLTKDTLEVVVPRAEGGVVMGFSMIGRPPATVMRPSVRQQTTGNVSSRHHLNPGEQSDVVAGSLDVVAIAYSVEKKDIVARVSMHYVGSSAEDAMRQFVAKLKSVFPGATCAGWRSGTLDTADGGSGRQP